MRHLLSFRTLMVAFTVAAVVYAIRSGRPAGKFLGVPYEFRMPTLRRAKDRFWNGEDERMFTPSVFGLGWSLNFFRVVEKFRADNAVEEDMDGVVMPVHADDTERQALL